MDALDKSLLESMTYGGIIADERNKERLDRLVEQGLAHVVERPDGFFPTSPTSGVKRPLIHSQGIVNSRLIHTRTLI